MSSASAGRSCPACSATAPVPNVIASRRWWATAFPGHPYGREVNGTLKSLPGIGADDLRAYVKSVLARDGLKIAIVGNLDAAAAGDLIDRIFGALPAKADLRPVPAAEPQGLGQRIVIDMDVPQTVITFGRRGVFRQDPDFMAAYVVEHILGGGTFSSRLYSEVREKRGLAYGINDSLVWLKGTALIIGGTATRADRTAETLKVIEQRNQAHGGRRPDGGRVRQGQGLSEGRLCPEPRHLEQDRRRVDADPARRARHRLYRTGAAR